MTAEHATARRRITWLRRTRDETAEQIVGHRNLVGMTFKFEYLDETYKIEELTASELRWTRGRGGKLGEGDVEAAGDQLTTEV